MASAPLAEGRSLRQLFGRFVGYTLRLRTQAGLTAILVVIAPIVTAALLWSFKLLVDDVLVAGRMDLLPAFAAFYIAMALAKAGIEYVTHCTEAAVVEQIVKSLRIDVYAHVLGQSPGSPDEHGTADVLTRMSGDVDRTEYVIYTGPLAVLADGTASLFFLAFLLFLNWQLTLATLLVVPAFIWASYGLATPVRLASRLSREGQSHWMALAEERLESKPIVHAFGAVDREVAAFASRAERARWAELTARILQARQTALIEVASAFGGLIVIAVGAYQIAAGNLSVGALLAFAGAVGSLLAPLRALAKASGRFQHAAAGADRVASLLDCRSMVAERPDAMPLSALASPHVMAGKSRGQLAFHNVGFKAADGRRILENVSLIIEPGETVALVGPSGAGKSTLARLAMRLQDPTEGSVLIDGIDVRDITLASLHRTIVPVFQDAYVLNGTVTSNILYGNPRAQPHEVAAAARAAFVDRFALAERGGLLSPVGRGGSQLSGGQRQRIALARALIANAPILLLDEAIAAVDSETEELIQTALDELAGQRTILTVAHRLSSIRRANRVFVMEHGRIVESGTPDSLLATRSRCREIFAPQLITAEAAE